MAARPVRIGLLASSLEVYERMEDFLVPSAVSHVRRLELARFVSRVGDAGAPDEYDLVLCELGIPGPPNSVVFYPSQPSHLVREVLDSHSHLGIPLARRFYPFRRPVVDETIQTVSRENALFAIATALPNVIPNIFELPWAISEFASDSAFLTVNQIRMAFLIAAASNNPVGYGEQKGEIASIIAGAFGWRALARELVGKIPAGGGLIAKGAVAFAGTYVVGRSLERYHRLGYGYSHSERKQAYGVAFERGKHVVGAMVAALKGKPQSAAGDS